MTFLVDALIITLVGMGTVFSGLIIIWFIISTFKYISKLEALGKNRKEQDKQKKEVPKASIEEVIPETVEEVHDDLELVAVIASVIAASMNTSVDQLKVRSIKRIINGSSNWQTSKIG